MGLFRRRKPPHQYLLEVQEEWPTDASHGFVIVDMETTGLAAEDNRIIEIALIRTDNFANPLGYWSTFVNPEMPIPNSEIHNITDTDVANAPTFSAIVDDIVTRLDGQVLVGHNISFDTSFLESEFARLDRQLPALHTVCTVQESHYFLPGLSSRRLTDCMAALSVQPKVEHRALEDAVAITTLFNFFVNCGIHPTRSEFLRSLPQRVNTSAWPPPVMDAH